MPIFAVLAILAVGDVFWGSLFSGIALIAAAMIAKSNTHKINSIDRAVNDQDSGLPTLIGRMISQDKRGLETAEELAEFRKWTTQALGAIADHHGIALPTKPETVPVKPEVQSGEPTTK